MSAACISPAPGTTIVRSGGIGNAAGRPPAASVPITAMSGAAPPVTENDSRAGAPANGPPDDPDAGGGEATDDAAAGAQQQPGTDENRQHHDGRGQHATPAATGAPPSPGGPHGPSRRVVGRHRYSPAFSM